MGIEINKETLDYLRAELSEKVRAEVEGQLFRSYRKTFSVIIAVLAAVGITIGWPTFQALVNNAVEKAVQRNVEEPVKKAQSTAQQLREEAQRKITEVQVRIEDVQNAVRTAQEQRADLEAKVRASKDNAEKAIKYVDQELDAVSARFRDLQAAGGDVTALGQRLIALTEQVQAVDAALRQLADEVQRPGAITPAKDVQADTKAITDQTGKIIAPSGNKTTVYVQFAGSSRDQIVQLTDLLRTDPMWSIPGEERTSAAAGKRFVRYYYKEDEAAANNLQNEVQKYLAQLNYQAVPVTTDKQLAYPKKPQRGIIELWIELPPKS